MQDPPPAHHARPDTPPDRPARELAHLQRRPTRRLLGAATLLAALAWALIVGLNEPGEFPGWYRCPLLAATGVLCPGCGSTRATHELLNGHPLASLRMNPLLIGLGIPAGALIIATAVQRLRGRPTPMPRLPGWSGYAVLGVVLAFWAVRNIPLPALEFLRPISPDPHADHDHSHESGPEPASPAPGSP